jgi:hypothetical protein
MTKYIHTQMCDIHIYLLNVVSGKVHIMLSTNEKDQSGLTHNSMYKYYTYDIQWKRK